MKRNAIGSALVALALGIAGAALAQGDGDEQARALNMQRLERQQQMQRNQQPAPRTHQAPPQRGYQQPVPHAYQPPPQRGYQPPVPRAYDQRGPRVYERQAERGDRHFGGRGFGPDHRFYRGDRLPPQYRGRSYVVDNWHYHHLSPPPRGYHWIQYGGDYVLVAISTGIIMQMILAD